MPAVDSIPKRCLGCGNYMTERYPHEWYCRCGAVFLDTRDAALAKAEEVR